MTSATPSRLLKDPMYLPARKWFIIDGIGAVLSAFLLGVVLVEYESFFGIPTSALYLLAAFPIAFALYDFICYHWAKENAGKYLRIIAIANILYCFISIGFALYHAAQITVFGWTYLIVEISIVLFLARLEWKVGRLHPNS